VDADPAEQGSQIAESEAPAGTRDPFVNLMSRLKEDGFEASMLNMSLHGAFKIDGCHPGLVSLLQAS